MEYDDHLEKSIESVLKGDREAYRRVIEVCESKIRLVIAAILPDRDMVDDVTQKAFLVAYTKLKVYEQGSDFTAWIKEIARKLALNERRKYLRKKEFKSKYTVHVERLISPELEGRMHQMEVDVKGVLENCLNQLRKTARMVIDKYYFENQSCKEIAQNLNKQSAWVRLVMHRTRIVLAQCLEKRGIDESAG